jgi:hypothetical protein
VLERFCNLELAGLLGELFDVMDGSAFKFLEMMSKYWIGRFLDRQIFVKIQSLSLS